jgi:hypothetical protein
MNPRRFAASAVLCGTAVLAGWASAGLSAQAEVAGLATPENDAAQPPDTLSVQIAALVRLDPAEAGTTEAASPVEDVDECAVAEACIDEYLWSLYQRAPKVDTIKVVEKIKATVRKKGKTRTITRTVTRLVDEDFAWKDPKAAEKAGMPLMQYVIGGMDRRFKLKLYDMLRALDDAGLAPGITSAFRDDYRQALARGLKAATDSSYHGGSRRGGYGRGLAADIVSVRGETRFARLRASAELWKWVDAHGKDYGIGRPYLDRDPPHVGPIDGREYVDKRGAAAIKAAALQTKKRHAKASQTKKVKAAALQTKKIRLATLQLKKRGPAAARADHGAAKRARTAKAAKVSG